VTVSLFSLTSSMTCSSHLIISFGVGSHYRFILT
jgi:hypothetical protein